MLLQVIKDLLAVHNTQGSGILPKESPNAPAESSDGSDDSDGDEAKKKVLLDAQNDGDKQKDADVVMADAEPTDKAAGVADAQPKYLTPTEAREMMKRIWTQNSDVLKFIFPGSSTAGGALALMSDDDDKGKNISSWQDFFIQTIPVAPNRYD